MTRTNRSRYSLVICTVASHQPYGLVVRSSSGEAGFVDSADIADGLVPRDSWPAVGEHVDGVVLGYTNDQRLRVSARPADVSLVRSVTDPAVALQAWTELQKAFPPDDTVLRRFLDASYAHAVLRWALRHPDGTVTRASALRLLSLAPEAVREGFEPGENEGIGKHGGGT